MTEEDEAFDEIARKQGMWGGGFMAKRAMAADKLQEPVKLWLWKNFVDGKPEYWAFDNAFPIFMDSHDPQTLGEPCGYAWLKLSRVGRTDVSDEQVLQDVQKALAQPAQEPYDQTALELCNVCGWKTLIPDDGCLNCERAQPAQEPMAHPVIAGALFDFMGWLTSRKKRIVLSSADEASPAIEAITEFAKMRNLSLDDAQVREWKAALAQPAQPAPVQECFVCNGMGFIDGVGAKCRRCDGQGVTLATTPPQRPWVGLTEEDFSAINQSCLTKLQAATSAESILKEKNF